jgi:hypothetical protein
MEYNGLLNSILRRLIIRRDARVMSIVKEHVVSLPPSPFDNLKHFEFEYEEKDFNTGNFRMDYLLEQLSRGSENYQMMGALLRSNLSQDGYDKLFKILMSHVAATPECLQAIKGEFMDEAEVSALFAGEPCAKIIVKESSKEDLPKEGRFTIFLKFSNGDEVPIRFNMRPCKVIYLFFLLHPRLLYSRVQLSHDARIFTNLFALLYPSDTDSFELTIKERSEYFFKQYRPALNRTIESTFAEHNEAIGRTDDPRDLVWYVLELNRNLGNMYSISLPAKFIELPDEIKGNESLYKV